MQYSFRKTRVDHLERKKRIVKRPHPRQSSGGRPIQFRTPGFHAERRIMGLSLRPQGGYYSALEKRNPQSPMVAIFRCNFISMGSLYAQRLTPPHMMFSW